MNTDVQIDITKNEKNKFSEFIICVVLIIDFGLLVRITDKQMELALT